MVEETDLLLYQSNSLRPEDLSREGNHTLQICSRAPLSGFYLATIETLLGALEGARIP